jgi:hypothetical protein
VACRSDDLVNSITRAIAGAAGAAPTGVAERGTALVVGAGGKLGSALLAETLASARYARVLAVIREPLGSAIAGLVPLPLAELGAPRADTAFVVFERERHSNRRDDVFHRPDAADLLPLARSLRGAGVRRLLVVPPQAPALLPQALRAGFASSEEAAVAAIGFEHFVLVRPVQAAAGDGGARAWVQRLAHWWLSQLRWMVPQREQPVLAERLAQVVVALALELPQTAPRTLVAPQDLLWLAAQSGDPRSLLAAWLRGQKLPEPPPR